MKPIFALTGGVALVGLIVWFVISREVDQWRICRSLGHGLVYCVFAQGGSK